MNTTRDDLRMQEKVDRVRNGLAMCFCSMEAAIMSETDYQDEVLFAVRDSLGAYIEILADVSEKLGNSGLSRPADENEA